MRSRQLIRFALCAITLGVSAAGAREMPLVPGPYSSVPDCAEGPDAMSGEVSRLWEGGMEAVEFRCVFTQQYELPYSGLGPKTQYEGFVALGFCEEPGLSTPHVFLAKRNQEYPDGRFTFTLVYQDEEQTIRTEYYPCRAAD